MRIGVVTTSAYGGLLHYALQLADGLAARGHEVDLIAPRGNEVAGLVRRARLRAVLPATVRGTEPPAGRVAATARRAAIAGRLVSAWTRVLAETRSSRYDALIVSSDMALAPAAAAGLAMTALPRRPVLAMVCHNVRIFNRWGGDELYREPPHLLWLFRTMYPRFDVVLVHGDRSRAEFEAVWPPSRLAVIAHGDERLFGDEPPPPSDEERLLFFGDWRKVKGLDALMEAFDELARRRPTARLTIAGSPAPGDFDPELVRSWAAAHGDRVEVVDRYVRVEEVRGLFGAARAVVTPYHTGSQSGVVHLAMTMGRPVVTTDVGDLGRAVEHGRSGLVVPPGDHAALVDALEHVLADAGDAERMGSEGRRRLDAVAGWDTVAEQVEAALDSARRRA